VVPEQQPIKSVKELIDYAKANPGKPYGTFGNATTSHLYGELLKKTANIDMTHVPIAARRLTNDLLQHGYLGVPGPDHGERANQGGKLRRWRLAAKSAGPRCPTPTMAELGYPGLKSKAGSACSCPPQRQRRSWRSFPRTRPSSPARGRRRDRDAQPRAGGWIAETFEKVQRRDYEKWADVVKAPRQGRVNLYLVNRHSGSCAAHAPE
jgi:tripartite-type tricarboxylate transporter receptor subunit TctC